MKLFFVFLLFEVFLKSVKSEDDFLDRAESFGYKGEVHKVETEDGYVLKVHRLLPRYFQKAKYTVFLMHGIGASSGDFILTDPKQALAFLLVDNGFDVWLGNARGNKYSTNHRNLSTEAPEFWEFSWHEIGFYDLPAMIDFMLKETNSSKAFYVGHSQGTTSLMVLLSTRPEYNEKIIQAHLMAPAVFFEHFNHRLGRFLKSEVSKSLDGIKYVSSEDFWKFAKSFRDKFCNETQVRTKYYCPGLVFVSFWLFGANKVGVEMDTEVLKILDRQISFKVSVKQLRHFLQLLYTKSFVQFDYKDGNLQQYNSSMPPSYELSNVKAEVYLYHGGQDLICTLPDIKHLKKVLPNVKLLKTIPNFNHGDFQYSKNSRKLLYEEILKSFMSVLE